MAQIRLPNITAGSPAEQIAQIRSYLYQLAADLQWQLGTLEGGTSTPVQVSGGTSDDILNVIRSGDNQTLVQAKEYTNNALNVAITEALEASY